MELSILLLVATFFVSLFSSILTGITGGGGGFIMTPWQLLIGFSPVQMVAAGSVGGSSIAIGSLLAMRRGGITVERTIAVVFCAIAIAASLIASVLLPRIDPSIFNTAIAVLTVVSLPLFFSKHHQFISGYRSQSSRRIGYAIMSLLIVGMSLLFVSTFSLLMTLALSFFFGTTTLESTSLRRIIGLVQMICLAILLHEHIVWIYTVTTITGGMLGSYIGTHIAVKRGDDFARSVLSIMAIVSAFALLF